MAFARTAWRVTKIIVIIVLIATAFAPGDVGARVVSMLFAALIWIDIRWTAAAAVRDQQAAANAERYDHLRAQLQALVITQDATAGAVKALRERRHELDSA